MTQTTTGQNIFRTRTTLSQADIFALDTTPVNLVPAIPGKSIALIGFFETYLYGTATYTTTGAVAQVRYGSVSGGSQPLGTTELVTSLISAKAVSQFKTVDPASVAAVALTTVKGLGLFLIATTTGFAATGGDGSIEIDVEYQVIP